jgi:hypothetical protein
MRDAVLAIVGTIGIAALVMSMNKEKKQVREDFNGFSLRNRLDKTVLNSKNSEYVHAIPVDKDPLIKCGPNSNSKPKSVEHFSNSKVTGNGLGANTVTNMPYITPTPHYNQSVNQPSPSLNLPAIIRYNAPSLSNMGVTENFQAQPRQVRENYENSSQCGRPTSSYMSPVSEYVGSNYTATPLPKGEEMVNHPADNLALAGSLDLFDGKEVMVFDRPMTTTMKVGRFAGRGTRDLIRGDLPVAPNTHCGWFSTPADPSALTKGALQAIAGENESSSVLNKFMEMYGDASNVGSGVNLADKPDMQYTAYEMTNKKQGVCGNTVSVTNF